MTEMPLQTPTGAQAGAMPEYNPPQAPDLGAARNIPLRIWQSWKDVIRKKYCIEKVSLATLSHYMKETYGFVAT